MNGGASARAGTGGTGGGGRRPPVCVLYHTASADIVATVRSIVIIIATITFETQR
jgi:hypothetical protein